jgi:predicted 3-demethylubiquinone-9 3-methyltransferase (glyoxalase superfamily)
MHGAEETTGVAGGKAETRQNGRYWNTIVDNGGEASECGWCQDRWGLSRQITPRVLSEAIAAAARRRSAPSPR